MKKYIKKSTRLLTYSMVLAFGAVFTIFPFLKKNKEFTLEPNPIQVQEANADIVSRTGSDDNDGSSGGGDGSV